MSDRAHSLFAPACRPKAGFLHLAGFVCPCVSFAPAVHVEDIIFHMFQYIQKLRTEGPQEWVFQECKVMNVF